MRFIALALAAVLLMACNEEDVAALPAPLEPAGEASAHFCGMVVGNHPGPKGQIWLDGRDAPLWFPSVRDTIAYLMIPEREARVVAVYVNDMGRAGDWDAPAAGAWVLADRARFVLESDRRGGMGLPEAVPFASQDAAQAFVDRHGGRIVDLADVTPDDVFGWEG